MDERKSFVRPGQHRNCFPRGINALMPRNCPIKTSIGMVIHNFHGLKTMTFHCVADLFLTCNYRDNPINILFFSLSVTSETCFVLCSSYHCRFPFSIEAFRDMIWVMSCFPCRNVFRIRMELLLFPCGFCKIYGPRTMKAHKDRNVPDCIHLAKPISGHLTYLC